jgi:hypothetical protein
MDHQWPDFTRLTDNRTRPSLNINCGPAARRKSVLKDFLDSLSGFAGFAFSAVAGAILLHVFSSR